MLSITPPNYASPIIANLPKAWIQIEDSLTFRTPTFSYGMYAQYDSTQLPPFDASQSDYQTSLIKVGAVNPTSTTTNTALDTTLPMVLQELFQQQEFFGSGNGCCHYWLRPSIGPLDQYLPNNQFCLIPFYHDQQSIMTWYALCDMSIDDPTLIGSSTNPCVVSGVSAENIEADDY